MPGWRRRAAITNRPDCSSTAPPSPSTPSSSARAPRPRSSLPMASATSTRLAASTGRTPTICSSASTRRWSSGRCASRSRSGCCPTVRSRHRSTRRRSKRSAACSRGSAGVANAYIGPIVRSYVGDIEDRIRSDGFSGSFLIVQSTGGLYDADQAKNHCVHMLESGPAAGVIGTQALCHALGLKNAIAFDMGGTTAKAGVIHNGEALTTGAALIGGYDRALPVQIAMMDIFEVGTGGGSMARVEEGALRVGPQSAGAAPGPACYGLGGTEPTVTDANLVLGRL